MKPTAIAVLIATVLATSVAAAGEPVVILRHHELLAEADIKSRPEDAWRQWAEDFSANLQSSMGTMFAGRVGGKVVKGAPYSAEVTTEANQSLADGNVISKKTSGRVYRDGEGRTRQEAKREGKEATIYISDPVESRTIMLTPSAKRAIVMPRSTARAEYKEKDKQIVRLGSTDIRVEDGKVFVDGKEFTGGRVEVVSGGKDVRVENGRVFIDGKEITAEGGRSVIVKKIEAGDGTHREEVRVQALRSADGKEFTFTMPPVPPIPPVPPVPPGGASWTPLTPMPPIPPLPGAHTMRFESVARLGKGVTTQLGAKDIEGVRAEGKSTVWTIAAGEIGNRNPIQITSESWYSPDLQLTVYSRYHDPRQGESIYRLTGIRRGEPGAELFKVPEGYEVKGRTPRDRESRG